MLEKNTSLFGFPYGDNPVYGRAYDMMVLDQIEKDEQEIKLKNLCKGEYDDDDLF